ncbi:unnamed protein product [Allacma fusca]|uniref:cAMP-dependent protein kinase n=1 Tax=Allacma fusca TaxID=39272 RepID=A0A8J2LS08_9HEXA|nr:unnamed protein product [Allacma fusca]
MPLFKDKAKKLMADMKQVRNRGTCKFVDQTSVEDENFIAHVQQVMGIDSIQKRPDSARSEHQDANNNRSSDKFANLVQKMVNEKRREKSIVTGFKEMSLGSGSGNSAQPEPAYNVTPEDAIIDFNSKWRAGRRFSYGSDGGSSTKSEPGGTVNDFHLLKTIGKGAFGKVLLVQSRISGQFYAMKVLNKKSIVNSDYVEGVLNEKRILECVSYPFLVRLHLHFKDNVNLYMMMEYVGGGDLFFHLRRRITFSEKEALFYGGQITLALEYLHSLNVIFRDLKPENILVNFDGYIKLTDFGLAKRLPSLDWWALGILLYEMVHGKSPFKSESEAVTLEKILNGKVKFGQTTNSFKHLIMNLLKDDVTTRIGTSSVDDIKNHPWFETISWTMLLQKRIEPPFQPRLHHRGDTRFFDKYDDNFKDILYMSDSEQDIYKTAFLDF